MSEPASDREKLLELTRLYIQNPEKFEQKIRAIVPKEPSSSFANRCETRKSQVITFMEDAIAALPPGHYPTSYTSTNPEKFSTLVGIFISVPERYSQALMDYCGNLQGNYAAEVDKAVKDRCLAAINYVSVQEKPCPVLAPAAGFAGTIERKMPPLFDPHAETEELHRQANITVCIKALAATAKDEIIITEVESRDSLTAHITTESAEQASRLEDILQGHGIGIGKYGQGLVIGPLKGETPRPILALLKTACDTLKLKPALEGISFRAGSV